MYNTRTDVWEDHFAVQATPPFQLEGKTSIGPATVERLERNAPLQLKARALWIVLGIFG